MTETVFAIRPIVGALFLQPNRMDLIRAVAAGGYGVLCAPSENLDLAHYELAPMHFPVEYER